MLELFSKNLPNPNLKNADLRVVVIYYVFCFDMARGHMNGAPNQTQNHSCNSASLACKPFHRQRCPELRIVGIYLTYH